MSVETMPDTLPVRLPLIAAALSAAMSAHARQGAPAAPAPAPAKPAYEAVAKRFEVLDTAKQSAYQTVRRDLALYGLWKFDPKNQLRVAVPNILKQDFVNENTYTDQSGTMRRVSVFPGVVVLRATMEMKF